MKNVWLIVVSALLACSACGVVPEKQTAQKNDSLQAYKDSLAKLEAFYKSKIRPYPEPLPDSVKARRLKNGARSAEALCDEFLLALQKRDTTRLFELTISREEYLNWIWKELPTSKPIFNIPLDFVWENNWRNSVKGAYKALYDYGGMKLSFAGLTYKEAVDAYQTYVFHLKPILTVADSAGKTYTLKSMSAIVEMNGLFKVLNYSDRD